MAGPQDLTNQNVSFTYNRLVQTAGIGNYYDGLGNPLVFGIGAQGDQDPGSIAKTFGVTIDGTGSDISTGIKGDVVIPYNLTINSWTIIAEQTGDIVIDLWKDTYANYPPTVSSSITGTEKPTLSSQDKNQDLSLSTWTTSILAGEIIRFNVDACSGIQRVTLSIQGTLT